MLPHATAFHGSEPPFEGYDPFILIAAALLTWNVTADAEVTAAVVAAVQSLLMARRHDSDASNDQAGQ